MRNIPAVSTQDKIAALRSATDEGHLLRFQEECSSLLARCESPIEELFLAAMIHEGAPSQDVHWLLGDYVPDHYKHITHPVLGCAQATVGNYRADFLFVQLHNAGRLVVVECDGHDFHERTKAQAAKDRSRDRWMAERGIRVFRFTGSEIYADAEACAAQIFNVIIEGE